MRSNSRPDVPVPGRAFAFVETSDAAQILAAYHLVDDAIATDSLETTVDTLRSTLLEKQRRRPRGFRKET